MPLYTLLFFIEFSKYILLYIVSKKFFKIKLHETSCNLLFPETFTPKIYLLLLVYTPRYAAFLIFSNLLNFKKKKITKKLLLSVLLIYS